MNLEELKVLDAIELKHMTIKNRIVRSATHSMLGNLDGSISDDELDMFEALASNHVGLIIAGQFFVTNDATAGPGSNELTSDRHIEAASKIMDRVKPFDTKVIAQLNHAGSHAYQTDSVGPSEISVEGIQRVKQAFVEAAMRAKRSGFDGVQLHAAHSYLLCEFLKPSVNKRKDQYGGSSENRFRLIGEIVEGIGETCGSSFPVFIKIDSHDANDSTSYDQDLPLMLESLKTLGIEAVEFSGSEFSTKNMNDHNYFLDKAVEVSKGKGLKTMLVGGIRNFNDMDQVLSAGIDMVSICRPFICEADFISKLMNGQEKARCVTCRKCPQAGRDRCILNVKK